MHFVTYKKEFRNFPMRFFRFLFMIPFKMKTVDFAGWWEGKAPDMSEEELRQLQIKYPVRTGNQWLAKWLTKWLAKAPLLFSIAQNVSIIKSCVRYKPTVVAHPGKGIGYVRIHKSGSSSIISSLFSEEIKNEQSLHAVEWAAYYHYLRQDHAQMGPLKYFTVVRNPFARLVSAYINSYKDDTTHHFVYDCYLFGIFRRHYTFAEFVDCVAAIPSRLLLDNIKPQKTVLNQAKVGGLRIFKLEEDQDKLIDFLRIDERSFKKLNHSSSYEYMRFYDAESFRKASKVYADDIVSFGYSKEFDRLREHLSLVPGHVAQRANTGDTAIPNPF